VGAGSQVIRRALRIPTRDGEVIRADLRVAEGPPPRTAILIVHGFKGFKDWAFFPYLAEELARDGHAVLSFNFSWNGIGEDPEAFTRLDAFGRNTLSRELEELHQMLALLRGGDLLIGGPPRIGVLGHSRGGAVSILAAREDPTISSLVTWAPVASFSQWWTDGREEWEREGVRWVLNGRTGQQMPIELSFLRDLEENRDRLEPWLAAGGVVAPWLLVHGDADPTVPIQAAHRLVEANPDIHLGIIEGAGHTFEARHPFESSTPALEEAIHLSREHFRRTLGRVGMGG